MREFAFAVAVCWFFNILAVAWIRKIRQKNENQAGVWIATLPRLGGTLTTAAALLVFLDDESSSRYIAALAAVYLASLPLAVYLTLPPKKR